MPKLARQFVSDNCTEGNKQRHYGPSTVQYQHGQVDLKTKPEAVVDGGERRAGKIHALYKEHVFRAVTILVG